MVERVGDEFLVTTTEATAGLPEANARVVSVAGLSDGAFVVTWEDRTGFAGLGSEQTAEVRGQVYDASGAPAGDVFQVNTTTQDIQGDPRVAGLSDDGFVVVWQDESANVPFIRGQVYSGEGTAEGSEFFVNNSVPFQGRQSEPDVAGRPDGGFVVTFSLTDFFATENGDGSGIWAQLYAGDGTPTDGTFLVNSQVVENQQNSAVTSLSNGGFVIVWEDTGVSSETSGFSDIKGQRYTPEGSPAGDEFLVNTPIVDAQIEPTVAGLSDGGFVVAWRDDGVTSGELERDSIQAQIFNADGSARGDQFLVNTLSDRGEREPSATGLPDGGFVITWERQTGTFDSSREVRAQAYDADGTQRGDEFGVNTTTAEDQTEPSVASLTDGFVVVWEDESIRTDASETSEDLALRGQIYAAGTSPGTDGPSLEDTTPAAKVQVLYILYFGRPAEPAGLDFWVSYLNDPANGPNLEARVVSAADRFADSPEALANYPVLGLDTPNRDQIAEFVNSTYRFLFERDVEGTPDDPTTGLGFWTERVQQELVKAVPKLGEIVLQIFNGAQNDDVRIINSKLTASEAFTARLDERGASYDGDAAAALLSNITSPLSEAEAETTGVDTANNAPLANATAVDIAFPIEAPSEAKVDAAPFAAGPHDVEGEYTVEPLNTVMSDPGF